MIWTESLPAGYRGSQGDSDDLDELVALIRAVDLDISGSSTATADSLRTMFGEPGFDPTNDIITVRTDGGMLVALAFFTNREPYVNSWTSGFVHPDHVGQGIGYALIDWVENRAASLIGRAPSGTRIAVTMGANDNNERAKRLLTSRGYHPERAFIEMEIGLDTEISVAALPKGIRIRTIGAEEDVSAMSAATTEAFRDHFGFTESPPEARIERWRQWRTSEMWDDDLVWLAMDGDRIVGVNVCLSKHGAKEHQGYVATLGVVPDWRGRGLARSLLTLAFAEYQRRGKTSVSLHVDADSITGATRLYTGVGMREVARDLDFEKEIRGGKDIVVR